MNLPATLTVEKARVLLSQTLDLREVKKIKDQAMALAAYARAQNAAQESKVDAEAIETLALRRGGEILQQIEKAKVKAPPRKRRANGKNDQSQKRVVTVEGRSKRAIAKEAGFDDASIKLAYKLADMPEEDFQAALQVAAAKGKAKPRSIITTTTASADYDSDEWGTDLEIIEAAHAVMGGIDIDPATTAAFNKFVRAKKFYTKQDNGLQYEWNGRLWLNPPYSQPLVSYFVKGFVEECQSGRASQGLILLNSSTDTEWFHTLGNLYPFVLTRGRRGFLDPKGKQISQNRLGQVIFYHGKNRQKFKYEFSKFGLYVRKG